MPHMSGSRFMSETFKGYGVTHLFVMPYVLNPVLRDCEQLGICLLYTSDAADE